MTASANPLVPRRPALFLDRDGVVNEDRGYVHRIEEFEFLPGIFALCRFAARRLGWPIIIVTNQSGIGRGYYGEAEFLALDEYMRARFAAEGAPIARTYFCPYHAEHGLGEYRQDHPWRKPLPGMILQAAEDFDLDLAASVMIGDSLKDVLAGNAAGVGHNILVSSAEAPGPRAAPAHVVVPDLTAALRELERIAA